MKSGRVCGLAICAWAIAVFSLFALDAHAEEKIKLWKNQTVYVPIYSHIFVGGNEKLPLNLAVNLVIRNSDDNKAITIRAIRYYDSEGSLLKDFIPSPRRLNPMASTYFLIRTDDTTGGWGANFIVVWEATEFVAEPIVEAIFTGARGSHSYSFSSQGKAVKGIHE